jgi:glycosyltransferase involved in cell wall biosynthesis
MYTSTWALQGAVQSYGIDEAKLSVVPFMANMNVTRSRDEIVASIESKPADRIDLLFIGVDWVRKGGDIALDLTQRLRQMGKNAHLSIVGVSPFQESLKPNYVHQYGFISKKENGGSNIVTDLMLKSHFLVMPSRAECFGIVFLEAAAHGLPSIASRVGGIPEVIRDNENGITSDFSDPADVATRVAALLDDQSLYKQMCVRSRDIYDREFSADECIRKIEAVLR